MSNTADTMDSASDAKIFLIILDYILLQHHIFTVESCMFENNSILIH
jgi:hypothetical protein